MKPQLQQLAELDPGLAFCYRNGMTPRINDEVEKAVQDQHGCTRIEGKQGQYIVMSIDTFRDMMGVGSDEELAASLRAVEQGRADVRAGRTRPYNDVIADLR